MQRFQLKSGGTWVADDDRIQAWQRLYPNLDVPQELSRAAEWCRVNPTGRKTRRGIERFCVAWLGRSDRTRATVPSRPVASGYVQPPTVDWFEECQARHGGTCPSRHEHDFRAYKEGLAGS